MEGAKTVRHFRVPLWYSMETNKERGGRTDAQAHIGDGHVAGIQGGGQNAKTCISQNTICLVVGHSNIQRRVGGKRAPHMGKWRNGKRGWLITS